MNAPGTLLAAAGVAFAAAYVAVRAHAWATRTPSGRAVVALLRVVRLVVVALAVGICVVAVLAYQAARSGWRTALRGASAPERWRRSAGRIDPRLADDPGTVPRHGGYTPTPSGGVYHVRLPEGRTWRDLEPDRVASAFGASSALVTPGATGERANVRVRTRDTLATPRPAPTPAWAGPRVTIGWTEDDAPLAVDLTISHVAVGGASRAGKSNALHQLIAAYAANPACDLWLLDGKEGAELGAWAWRCSAFDRGDDDGDDRVTALLQDVLDTVKRRNRENAAAGRQKSGDHHPHGLVVVDEAATYSSRVKGFDALLADLMRRSLAVNVAVVIATQKATADAIPTVLRDLCETRVAFRCSSREMGVAVLGEAYGRYAADLPSVVTDPARNAGRCVVVAGGDVTLGRAFHADEAWLAAASSTPADADASPPPTAASEAPTPRAHDTPAHPSAPARTRAERRAANRDAHRAAQSERNAARRREAS